MYSKFLTKNTKLLKESKRKSFKRFKRLSESTPAYEADFEAYDEKYLQSVIDDFCNNCSTPDLARAVFDACGDSAIDALIEAKDIYVAKNGSKDTGTFTKNDAIDFIHEYDYDIYKYLKSIGEFRRFTKYGEICRTYGEEEGSFYLVCFIVDTIVAEFFDNVELDDSGLAD